MTSAAPPCQLRMGWILSGVKLKATVENPRGSVEKLSPKESVEGTDTVLRGSVRALKGFSEGKPKAQPPRF